MFSNITLVSEREREKKKKEGIFPGKKKLVESFIIYSKKINK